MSWIRIMSRSACCLVAGGILSYAVAWGIEYQSTGNGVKNRSPDYAEGGTIARQWPVPIGEWPVNVPRGAPAAPETVVAFRPTFARRELVSMARRDDQMWYVNETRSGWPVLSTVRYAVTCESVHGWSGPSKPDDRAWYGGWHGLDKASSADQTVKLPVRLPVKPLWNGLTANATFYGVAIYACAAALGWGLRERRRRRGLCVRCAYSVGTSAICTECGLVSASHGR